MCQPESDDFRTQKHRETLDRRATDEEQGKTLACASGYRIIQADDVLQAASFLRHSGNRSRH